MSSSKSVPVTRRLRGRAVTRPCERNRTPPRAAGEARVHNRVTGVTAGPETKAAPRFCPVTRPVTRLSACVTGVTTQPGYAGYGGYGGYGGYAGYANHPSSLSCVCV